MPALLVGLVIMNAAAYGLSYTQRVNRNGDAMAYGQYKLNALYRAINTCTSVTEALADVIIIDKGEVADFDTLAEAVYEKNDFLRSVQLAPDGVVTYVYPEQGNESGKINLFTDPDRKAEAYQAKRSGQTNVAGPFNLKQGGFGMAIRQPVYLEKDDTGSFWGFSIVICDMDDVLHQAAFESIDRMGYKYRLTAVVDNEEVFVSGLKGKTGGVTVEQTIYGKRWRLTMFPKVSITDRLFFWGFMGMMFLIVLLVSALVSRNRALISLNDTDALTGLKNRRGFDKAMAEMAADRKVQSACIIAIDINNFKSFNDLYGHSVGDVLLMSFADELSKITGRTGILSRNGGDEFQMLIKNPKPGWEKSVQDFFNGKHYFETGDKEYFFYVSAGAAMYPQDSRDFHELYRKADAALYHAKSKVHHHISYFRAEMDDENRKQMGFTFKDLAGGTPGAVLIYKDDASREILYANDACLHLFGCDTMQQFMQLTKRSFGTLIYSDDVSLVEQDIQNRQQDLAGEGEETCKYRILTKQGTVKEVYHAGRRVRHEYYGEICYVLLLDLGMTRQAEGREGENNSSE